MHHQLTNKRFTFVLKQLARKLFSRWNYICQIDQQHLPTTDSKDEKTKQSWNILNKESSRPWRWIKTKWNKVISDIWAKVDNNLIAWIILQKHCLKPSCAKAWGPLYGVLLRIHCDRALNSLWSVQLETNLQRNGKQIWSMQIPRHSPINSCRIAHVCGMSFHRSLQSSTRIDFPRQNTRSHSHTLW